MADKGNDRSPVSESVTTPSDNQAAVRSVEPPSLVESFPNVDWDEKADEPLHPLTTRELDVLRYLPTRLSNIDGVTLSGNSTARNTRRRMGLSLASCASASAARLSNS